MRQSAPEPFRRLWRQSLIFGVPLALIEGGIVVFAIIADNRLPPQPAALYGLIAYFLMSIVAGYQFGYRGRHEGWQGTWAGFRTGVISGAIVLLGATAWMGFQLISYINSPPPSHPGTIRGGFYSPQLATVVALFFLGALFVLNGVGVMLSAFGGRIGGALAQWQGTRQARQPQG